MSGRRRFWVGLAGCAAAILLPASASPAAVTIGSNLAGTGVTGEASYCPGMGTCTGTNLNLPAGSLAPNGLTSPIDGVVVRWRVKSGSAGNPVALRVLRPVSGTTFTGAGTSSAGATSSGTAEFASQVPIKAGDSVGLNVGNQGLVWATTPSASTVIWGTLNGFSGGLADGATGSGDAVAPLELLVQAVVEPDCDGDGLGDETQDGDLSPCSPDTAPPDTTITSGPKKVVKTKKKKVTVSFAFTSSEPNSSFQCQVDGGAFQPCSSPFATAVKAKRKPRDHSFAVRAIDAAGNNDSTPASFEFKAKRKKKKHH